MESGRIVRGARIVALGRRMRHDIDGGRLLRESRPRRSARRGGRIRCRRPVFPARAPVGERDRQAYDRRSTCGRRRDCRRRRGGICALGSARDHEREASVHGCQRTRKCERRLGNKPEMRAREGDGVRRLERARPQQKTRYHDGLETARCSPMSIGHRDSPMQGRHA